MSSGQERARERDERVEGFPRGNATNMISKERGGTSKSYSIRSVLLVGAVLIVALILAGCASNTSSSGVVDSNEVGTAVAETSSTTTVDLTEGVDQAEGVGAATVEPQADTYVGPIKVGDTVKVHYIGTLGDGTVFDSSRDRDEPLEFVVGSGSLIDGFDQGVLGMETGDTKVLVITPEDGYGERSEDNVVELPATASEMEGLAVGDTVYVNDGTVAVTIVAIGEESITVDGNHPLAGKTLQFDIEIVEVTPGN